MASLNKFEKELTKAKLYQLYLQGRVVILPKGNKSMLNGKKTYIICVLMLIYAISAFALGKIDANQAWQIILEALAIAGLRHGFSNTA